MYRLLFTALCVALFSVMTVGCGVEEIEPEKTSFKADPEAAKKGMQQAMEKMGQHMRPEQKAAFEKMQRNPPQP